MPFIPLLDLKRETKQIGRIKQEQMVKPNTKEWILERINPKCEKCNSNDYYTIDISFIRNPFFPFSKIDKIFRILCPNCGETIELDIEEFVLIEPFIKINSLFESGKIDEYEYKYRLEKIEAKHHNI